MEDFYENDIKTLDCNDKVCRTCLKKHIDTIYTDHKGKIQLKQIPCIMGESCM